MTPGEDASQFCDRVRSRLVGSLTLYCGDRGVAEELAQEALVRAWLRWPAVSAMASPEAWTFRTGVNLANSWLRRRGAEGRANRQVASSFVPGDSDIGERAVAAAVRDAVRSLAPRQRAIVIARFFLDLSVDETAQLLRCAPGTVKATTSQAIARLRGGGLLDDHEPEEVS
jgi:RNA polymerase sigma factor (sigma-70 family)